MTDSVGGEKGVVRFQYRRFYVDYEEEYESLHDAMIAAYYGSDHNELYPVKIIYGSDEYDLDGMEKYWNENGIR